MSLNKKVTLAFAFLSVLIGGLGFISYQALSVQRNASVEISEVWLPNVSKSDEINLNVTKFRMAELDFLLVKDATKRTAIKERFDEYSQNLFIYRRVYEPLIQNDEQRKLYDQFAADWDKYIEAHDKLILAIEGEKADEANALISQTEALFNNASKSLTDLSNISFTAGTKASEAAGATFLKVKWVSVALSTFSLLSVFIVGFYIRKEVRQKLGPIAKGTAHSAELINESVHQLAQSSRELSQRSAESAASLQETVAAMEEVTATVKLNTESAKTAADISQMSQNSVGQGQKNIQLMIENMKEVAESSRKIGDILVIIEDISFQTNLLALNAAVEAARAGEQGKGFAVVADAVRVLAQKSAASAKEIGELIHASSEKTNRGVQLATNSEKSLEDIVSSVTKVTALVRDIANAAEEQNIGVSQISQAFSVIDQSIQGNAENTQIISESSESLQSQAQTLDTMAQNLRNFSGVTGEEENKRTFLFWKKKPKTEESDNNEQMKKAS